MQDSTPTTVLFVGRPGSGKGTQAKVLAKRLGWTLFSSGGFFKNLIDTSGPHSELIRRDYEQGQLSPDWLAVYFFEHALLDIPKEAGFVGEGFPRSMPQAELADEILTWLGRSYKVIHLRVGEDEALKRQLERAKTEDRPDSNDDAKVRTRFDVYRTRTESVTDFFKEKGVLIEINGEQTPEAIATDINVALGL